MQLDYDEESMKSIAKWMACNGGAYLCVDATSERSQFILIQTLEGDMKVSPGDWVVRGVKGEFYPCKPDIFAELYEPA